MVGQHGGKYHKQFHTKVRVALFYTPAPEVEKVVDPQKLWILWVINSKENCHNMNPYTKPWQNLVIFYTKFLLIPELFTHYFHQKIVLNQNIFLTRLFKTNISSAPRNFLFIPGSFLAPKTCLLKIFDIFFQTQFFVPRIFVYPNFFSTQKVFFGPTFFF